MTKDKGGRPKGSSYVWLSETTVIRIPSQYADALKEIAKEWQQSAGYCNKNS